MLMLMMLEIQHLWTSAGHEGFPIWDSKSFHTESKTSYKVYLKNRTKQIHSLAEGGTSTFLEKR